MEDAVLTPEQRSRFAWWGSVRGWVATRGKLSRRQLLLSLIPIFGFTGLLSSAELPVFVAVPLVVPLACLAAFVFVLRLRDADMHPAFVLLGLIPLLGWAGLAALLTYPTTGQKNTYTRWQSFFTGAAPFLTMALIASVIAPAAEVSPDSPTAVVESGEQSAETESAGVEAEGSDLGAEGDSGDVPADDVDSGVFTGEEDPVEGEATDDGVVDQAPVEEAPPAPPVAGTASGLEGLSLKFLKRCLSLMAFPLAAQHLQLSM